MKLKEYEISLRGFPIENGSVPLETLALIHQKLKRIGEGAIRLAIEGNSRSHGRTPLWLKDALNVNLKGIRTGSTVLEMSAPTLKESILGQQVGTFFNEINTNDISSETAVSLVIKVFKQAFGQDGSPELLDKNLLSELRDWKSILPTEESTILFKNQQPGSEVILSKEKLNALAAIEKSIPAPTVVKLVGKLEQMNHSSAIVRVLSINNAITKVHLPREMSIEELTSLFGKDVKIQGMANYNAAGKVISIEAKDITANSGKVLWFGKLQEPFQSHLNLIELKQKQGYQTVDPKKLRSLGKDIEVEQSLEDLLNQL